MTNKIKTAILSAALLAGVVGVAAANPTMGARPETREGRKTELLEKYDTNHDGKLDASERAAMKADFAAKRDARLTARFEQIDTNKDGRITLAELEAWYQQRAIEAFAKMDANKTGSIDMTQFKASKVGHGPLARHHHRRGGKGAKAGSSGNGSAAG